MLLTCFIKGHSACYLKFLILLLEMKERKNKNQPNEWMKGLISSHFFSIVSKVTYYTNRQE